MRRLAPHRVFYCAYSVTAIPNNAATTVVAMIAERRVKRRPSLKAARSASE